MTNPFIRESARGLRALQRAQVRRARLEARAQHTLDLAVSEHRDRFRAAEALEKEAWRELLAVPGMTPQTAAALCGVSVATVSRGLKGGGDER
jgi:hypothetical protein